MASVSVSVSVQDIEPSIWNNIASFLNTFEQCKILVLCHYLQALMLPHHHFDNDIKYWQDNFKCYAEFGFADINVKDKITTLSIDNGLFDAITKEQSLYLLYFLKYHTKIAALYQEKVEEILNDEIEDYSGDFYKEIKFLYSLNVGDNNSAMPFNFVIKYIESMTSESKVLKVKKCALLKEINLNGNDLDDDCLLLFCQTIDNNLMKWVNLRRLDLSDNEKISDKYIPLLFENIIIHKCDGLDYLGLESCSITDVTINYIYNLCMKYPKKVLVKHLNLQFNQNITDKAADKITAETFQKQQQMVVQI